ncbi:MAG: MtaA/CmuA family methyltransferase, partial [Chloroflexi bacterium]|nr:MtaA/CmuA family methyltransferase [Chloroflexota bacterium]
MTATNGAETMTGRERYVNALLGKPTDVIAVGSPTSLATYEQMRLLGIEWPEAHYSAEAVALLAERSYTDLGFDTIAPYFCIIMGAAALGATIDWGSDPWEFDKSSGKIITGPRMPAVKPPPPWVTPDDIVIPDDFLERRESRAIIDAIKILRADHPDAGIVGKVMGPWTLAYHMFGPQEFLINVILDPDYVHQVLDRLRHVSVMFANAQLEAGADVITLADHSTGDLVRAETYRDFLLPVHQKITPLIEGPVILHCCGKTIDRMPYITEAGFEAFHFATENNPHEAKKTVGDYKLVGNASNFITLLTGRPEDVAVEIDDLLAAGVDIIAPECAVP